MRLIALAVAVLVLAGCQDRPLPGAKDFVELRTYDWELPVAEPQAEWNPVDYRVVARLRGGFAVLEEGRGKQEFYVSDKKRRSGFPAWIDANRFVYGPPVNTFTGDDGKVVPAAGGLWIVALRPDRSLAEQQLTKAGFRPLRWRDQLICQVADRVMIVGGDGTMEEFTRGFEPRPQPDGLGLCWLERPVLEPDLWTASTDRRGHLIIRWRENTVSKLHAAIEPVWDAEGGVYATVLKGEPSGADPWWKVGTRIVRCAGPGKEPMIVVDEAHDVAPHPRLPLIACVANDGRVLLVDRAGGTPVVVAQQGTRPRWSHDGRRLMTEEPLTDSAGTAVSDGRVLRVRVYKITGLMQ